MRCNPMSVIKNPDGTWTDDGAHVFGRLEEGGRSSEAGTFVFRPVYYKD